MLTTSPSLRFGAIQVLREQRIEPKKEPVRYEISFNLTDEHQAAYQEILTEQGRLDLVAVNDRLGFSLNMPPTFDWKNALQVEKLGNLLEKLTKPEPDADVQFDLLPDLKRKFSLWMPIFQNGFVNSVADHLGLVNNYDEDGFMKMLQKKPKKS